MAELERIICTYCGASMEHNHGSKSVKCKYCNSEYHFKEEKGPALILALNNAAGYLCRHDFDSAIVNYESILKEYPKDSEAAWGHAISTYGIIYEKDDRTLRMIPTCSRIVKESILNNRSYLLALENSTDRQREIYEENAAFIDKVQKRIKSAMDNEEDFDVFISFKAKDENGIVTEDSVIARNIYEELKRRGIKAFFSEVSLKNRFGDEFEPVIYRALYSCKFFILVSTKEEYIEAPWVKNEWTRFRDRVLDESLSGACAAVYKGFSSYELPRAFRGQGIELEKHPFDYAQLIADNLSVKLGFSSKEKEALEEQKRRNAELEEKQRRMEEELERIKAENESFARSQQKPVAPVLTVNEEKADKPASSSTTPVKAAKSSANTNKTKDKKDMSGLSAEQLYQSGVDNYNKGIHSTAVELFLKAAESNHADAQNYLGFCYANGKGVMQNYVTAVQWYQKAANQGHVSAQFNLAACYANGNGVDKDNAAAFEWYQKAAMQGHGSAQYYLAACYKNGTGVARDYDKAYEWYKKAKEQGDERVKKALRNLGENLSKDYFEEALSFFKKSQYNKAFESFTKASELGNNESMSYLGRMYENAFGVERDYAKSLYWYECAARNSFVPAYVKVGYFCENGLGMEKDYQKAEEWYRRAATLGNKDAERALAALDTRRKSESRAQSSPNSDNADTKPSGMIRAGSLTGSRAREAIVGNNEIGARNRVSNNVKPASNPDFVIEKHVLVKYNGTKSDVIIPAGVREIGGFVFADPKRITSVVVSTGVEKIGNSAFAHCDNIKKIDLPESLTEIGNGAFAYCLSMRGILIPKGVTSVGKNAFLFTLEKGYGGCKIVVANPENIRKWDKDWNPSGCEVYDLNGKLLRKNIFGVYK